MTDFFKTYPVEEATKSDAIAYVSLLLKLASVDGIDTKEAEAIKQLISYNGWEVDVFHEAQKKMDITIDSLNLSSEFIKVVGPFLIRDLCAIAHISNGFTKDEDDFINSIREKIGITSETYTQIKKAVSSQLDVIENWSKVIAA